MHYAIQDVAREEREPRLGPHDALCEDGRNERHDGYCKPGEHQDVEGDYASGGERRGYAVGSLALFSA